MMLVKAFAEYAGVDPNIVRYYARIGLLNPSRDPQNGYQQFGQEELIRIQFIRAAQVVGFTLSAIGDLIRDEMRGASDCCLRMRSLLHGQIEDAQEEIAEQQSRLQKMKSLLVGWSDTRGCGVTWHCICPQIESVTDSDVE